MVTAQRGAQHKTNDEEISELDPVAVGIVRAECWPEPRSPEELHEALGWMGWLLDREVEDGWRDWLRELEQDGRAVREGDRVLAAGSSDQLASVITDGRGDMPGFDFTEEDLAALIDYMQLAFTP